MIPWLDIVPYSIFPSPGHHPLFCLCPVPSDRAELSISIASSLSSIALQLPFRFPPQCEVQNTVEPQKKTLHLDPTHRVRHGTQSFHPRLSSSLRFRVLFFTSSWIFESAKCECNCPPSLWFSQMDSLSSMTRFPPCLTFLRTAPLQTSVSPRNFPLRGHVQRFLSRVSS